MPWWSTRIFAVVVLVYVAYNTWNWWFRLRITLNGIVYKEDGRVAQRHVATLQRKHGLISADCAIDAWNKPGTAVEKPIKTVSEWTAFGPSLPHGEQDDDSQHWLQCDGTDFLVRNVQYKVTHEKICSDEVIYDCVGIELVRDHQRIDSVIDYWEGAPPSPADSETWDPAWGVPRVIAVNCQLPYKVGWIWSAHPEDDGGVSVVANFVLSKPSCERFASGTLTPALGLVKRFVAHINNPKERPPIKVVGRLEEPERLEVPETFLRFNNKPVLLTKSMKVITHRLPEILELDYDVRIWTHAALTALCNYHQYTTEKEFEVGYVLEGRSEDELPEQMLGCVKIINLDLLSARWLQPRNVRKNS